MWRDITICVVLAFAVLLVYGPLKEADFNNYDDPGYYLGKPQVMQGLRPGTMWWALFSGEEFNWHPLTWYSYMLDHNTCEAVNWLWPQKTLPGVEPGMATSWGQPGGVFHVGGEPGFVHLMNVFMHMATAILLFLVLARMTKARWPSALVAALFALHPSHVESVAWIAERKDVLSGLFWVLTIGAYALYVERPNWKRYVLVCVGLVLGLMAKPMVVTLPLVLLLLDVWPLKRVILGGPKWVELAPREVPAAAGRAKGGSKSGGKPPAPRPAGAPDATAPAGDVFQRLHSSWTGLLIEKAPFLLLMIGSGIITYVVQLRGGAMQWGERTTFLTRLANAPVAYVTYVLKTLVPIRLSVFYPYNFHLPIWEVAAAVLALAAITVLVIWQVRRRPYLTVGWLYFLGTLVPVIGLVQVGAQCMADRYTYLTTIGLFIMIAWGVKEAADRWRGRSLASVPVAAVAVLVGLLMALTWVDCAGALIDPEGPLSGKWFAKNWPGGYDVFPQLAQAGGLTHGLGIFCLIMQVVLVAAAAVAWWWNRLAGLAAVALAAVASLALMTSVQAGYWLTTKTLFFHSLELDPHNAVAHCNLGESMFQKGEAGEAEFHFISALHIDWEQTGAHNNLGWALASSATRLYPQGSPLHTKIMAAAEMHYKESLRIDPENSAAHNNYALCLLQTGRPEEGIRHLLRALELNTEYAAARSNLGMAYMQQKEFAKAAEAYRKLAELQPDDMQSRLNLASALAQAGRLTEALEHIQKVLDKEPARLAGQAFAMPHGLKGEVLFTMGRYREAVPEFQRACQLHPGNLAYSIGLGRALKESGNLDGAVNTLRDVVKKFPQTLDPLVLLSDALRARGDVQEAADILRNILKSKNDYAPAFQRLASILATEPGFLNGPEAVGLAERACQITQRRDFQSLDALAAAYAETNQWQKAVATGLEAVDLLRKTGQPGLLRVAEEIQKRVELYKSGKPFRQSR